MSNTLPKVGQIRFNDNNGHVSVSVFVGTYFDNASYARFWRESWEQVATLRSADFHTWANAAQQKSITCG